MLDFLAQRSEVGNNLYFFLWAVFSLCVVRTDSLVFSMWDYCNATCEDTVVLNASHVWSSGRSRLSQIFVPESDPASSFLVAYSDCQVQERAQTRV